MEVQGFVVNGFERVQDAFAEAQVSDVGGAQLCVYHQGEQVVDLWCGQDDGNGRQFDADTITVLMSSTKAMTATAAHILVERGLLDLNAPVSKYWPEFAANGKADIPIAYLLSHKAGLSTFPPDSHIGVAELLDQARCSQALASMEPLWTPGTAFAYHGFTFGYLVGEVIRRVSGRTIGRFFDEEIARPLDLDLWLGLPEIQEGRVSKVFSTLPEVPKEQQLAMLQSFGIDINERLVQWTMDGALDSETINNTLNSRAGHQAEIPAGNGIGNARSLAKMYAAMIGEIDGVRLLQPASVNLLRTPQTDTLTSPAPFDKLPMPHPLRFALGYELNRSGAPTLGDGSFGHTGAGGRIGFAHPESGTAVAYVCNNAAWNYMAGPDARWMPWTNALRNVLKLD